MTTIQAFLFLAILIMIAVFFTLLGLKVGKVGRYISGSFFTLCAIYFGLLLVQAIMLESDMIIMIGGGGTFTSGVLGFGFLTGWIKGKNELKKANKQISS